MDVSSITASAVSGFRNRHKMTRERVWLEPTDQRSAVVNEIERSANDNWHLTKDLSEEEMNRLHHGMPSYRWKKERNAWYLYKEIPSHKVHSVKSVGGMIDKNHNGIDDRVELEWTNKHRRYLRLKRKSSIWRL